MWLALCKFALHGCDSRPNLPNFRLGQTLDFTVGYFKKSAKLWLNNEDDVHDAHDVLVQYGKLTFWCTGKKSKQRYYGSSD